MEWKWMDIAYQVEDVAIPHFASCQISMQVNQAFNVCFCFRRIFKLRIPEPPEDVKYLFEEYSENETMTLDGLHKFLTQFQGENRTTKDDAQAIFNNLKHLNVFQRKGLHLESFFRYLLSGLNAPLYPSKGVHHDMNAPLSHYFLYTGHNSYLTGNQFSSDSSIQPIVKALKRGVRVIELDLWPNKNQDRVEVRHGGTLTSSVGLLKCLRAIKEYAFHASEYPVVITFEDHLPQNLQAKVAKMVSGIFGDMLFCPASDQLEEFPSPESLKKKVMISTKPPKEYLEEKETTHKPKKSSKKELWETEDQLDEEEHLPDEDEEKTIPEYRQLIAIHAGKLKGKLENWLKVDVSKVSRLSLSEQELENATRTCATDIIRFTQRNLLRVYPSGLRLDSSNYDPFVGWMHGAQMVAFNMQGYGKYLWIMQGMFRANGGCGYVKKPEFLLQLGSNTEVFDPQKQLPVKIILKVKLYSGEGWHLEFRPTHFDRFSPPDFYVNVGIAGVPADNAKKQSGVVKDSWLPQWNQDFDFPLTVPEFAVLRIEVKEYDTPGSHDFGGQTCLPVSELRTGIRAVPLHDHRGEKYKSVKLLMKFDLVCVGISGAEVQKCN